MSNKPNDPPPGDRGAVPDPGREPAPLGLPRLILNWILVTTGLGAIFLLGNLL